MIKLKRGYKYFGISIKGGVVAVMGRYHQIPGYRFFIYKRKHLWRLNDLVTGMKLWDKYTQAQCLSSVTAVFKREPEKFEKARRHHKDAKVINDENGLRDDIELVGYWDGHEVQPDPDCWPEELRYRAPDLIIMGGEI